MNSIILQTDLKSLLFLDIYVIYLVMRKSLQMTVFFPTPFLQRRINYVLPCSLAWITDEVDHQWCLSSRDELLGVLSYCVTFMLASPTYLSVSF